MTLYEAFEKNGIGHLLDNGADQKLTKLYELLISFNEKVNVTAVTDEEGVYLKHFVDSATLLPYVKENAVLLDVGCGGGFPSLPIAILRNDVNVTSLDSTKKKLCFIDSVKEEIGLENVSALCRRAEELDGSYREKFDVVTARAVAPLNILCELCLPYVKIGGSFIAMKTDKEETASAEVAIAVLGGVLSDTVSLEIKGTITMKRRLIIVKKVRPTDARYPRKYSAIKTKPL